MDKNTKYALSIVVVVAMLLASGYTINKYSADDPEPNYKCTESKVLRYCARLSGTGLTCYPLVDSTKGYERCYSYWEKLEPLFVDQTDMGLSEKWKCPVGSPCFKV